MPHHDRGIPKPRKRSVKLCERRVGEWPEWPSVIHGRGICIFLCIVCYNCGYCICCIAYIWYIAENIMNDMCICRMLCQFQCNVCTVEICYIYIYINANVCHCCTRMQCKVRECTVWYRNIYIYTLHLHIFIYYSLSVMQCNAMQWN